VSERQGTRRSHRSVVYAAIGLGTAFFSGTQACTYDPSHPCGANESVYGDGVLCVCVDGAAMTQNGCVACGEHEVPGDGGCDCVAGYARPAPGAACALVPQGLGAACGAQNPCVDPKYNTCIDGGAPSDGGGDAGGAGYCTNSGCVTSSDCSNGYACDPSAPPPVCRRPPVGQGTPCMSSADCAGTEATFCDTVVSHSCLVQGCTLSPNDCFVGWTCCDLSTFGVPAPICLSLQGGACP
jgi:hypothetical protein